MNDPTPTPTGPDPDPDPSTTDPGGQVLASMVRAGDWLLVDGYVRQVVRVETITATPGCSISSASPASPAGPASRISEAGLDQPTERAQDAAEQDAVDGIPLQLRVSFLNGGSLVLTSNDRVEISRTARQDPTIRDHRT